jgi:hypothetical protein
VLECDLSRISGAKAKNKWMFPSVSQYAFISWCLVSKEMLKNFDDGV